jgi:hypothetical protein
LQQFAQPSNEIHWMADIVFMLGLMMLAIAATAAACLWKAVAGPVGRVLELHDELIEVEAVPQHTATANGWDRKGSFEADIASLSTAIAAESASPQLAVGEIDGGGLASQRKAPDQSASGKPSAPTFSR